MCRILNLCQAPAPARSKSLKSKSLKGLKLMARFHSVNKIFTTRDQEWAGNYDASFYVAGAFLLVAGVVSIAADIVRRRDKQGAGAGEVT